jgi:DNA-binding winged helix-turn-helix (wHTH) protein/TolB-like protein
MNRQEKHFYEFGPFRLDARQRLLLREGAVVPLTLKAFDLLMVLVESDGQVLSKDELMHQVWPDSFVEEANLSHHIHKLREALGQQRDGDKYIETLARRGYRFVAKTTEVRDRDADLIVEEHSRAHIVVEEDNTPERVIETKSARARQPLSLPVHVERRSTGKQILFVGGCMVLVGLVVGFVYLLRVRESRAVPGAPLHSIAVLPFRPLVASDRDESLEMGMADTLITRLTRIGQLAVRPTSAVRKYADPQQDAVAAGRELAVESVLDGSIQKQGDRVRVTVRLLSVPDGSQLWAKEFDERFTDIFAVQDTISAKVADALALKLSGSERELLARHYTENTEAFQLYLKGRFYWLGSKTEERIRKSIEYFNQAIQMDPNYALAYSGLADGYVVLGTYYVISPREAFAKATAAASRAVELDDTLAEAHASMSNIKLLYEFDWPGYEREYRRADELNPNYAVSHYIHAQYLAAMGRFDEATGEGKRAQELDPLSATLAETSAWMFYFARDYDGAIERQRKVIEFDPSNFGPHRRLGLAYLQKKMNAEALAEIQQSQTLSGGNAEEIAYLGYAYGVTGKRAEAEKVLDELQQQSKRRYVSPYLIALVYIGLSNKDQAFIWLEKAYEERAVNLMYLKVEPIFDPLRSDPRFTELLRRMNLSP